MKNQRENGNQLLINQLKLKAPPTCKTSSQKSRNQNHIHQQPQTSSPQEKVKPL